MSTVEVSMLYRGETRGGAVALAETEGGEVMFVPRACITNIDELGPLRHGECYEFEIYESVAEDKGLC